MNTTNLFSELLIVGTGGLAWYALLVIVVFGPEPITYILTDSSLNEFLITAVSFVSAYFLGVLLDRAYVPIWSKLDASFRSGIYTELDDYNNAQVLITAKDKNGTNDLLDFYRSRVRILRASMINFSLIAIFGVCASIDHSKVAIFFFISASAVSYLCFDGYKQLSIKLYNKTKEAANALA
jgi:hypothetical protein